MLIHLLMLLFRHGSDERDNRRSEEAARLRRKRAYEARKRKAKGQS